MVQVLWYLDGGDAALGAAVMLCVNEGAMLLWGGAYISASCFSADCSP